MSESVEVREKLTHKEIHVQYSGLAVISVSMLMSMSMFETRQYRGCAIGRC